MNIEFAAHQKYGKTFARYVVEGDRAIRQHPDFHPDGIEYETAATDQIASILHAVQFDAEANGERFNARELLESALVSYEGDFEDMQR